MVKLLITKDVVNRKDQSFYSLM